MSVNRLGESKRNLEIILVMEHMQDFIEVVGYAQHPGLLHSSR